MQELEDSFKKNGGRFEKFRIGDLFDIQTGSLVPSKKLTKGDIPRITVTSQNNGVIGYFDTENIEEARHFENFISVNFFGCVFYHPYKASCEMKVHVLKLKNHVFNIETGLYIAAAIRKVTEGNHSYGEQLSSSDLKKQRLYILLPTKDNEIAFSYMEQYVREVEAERVREVEAYLVAAGLNNYELTKEERAALEIMPSFGLFGFDEIFEKGKPGDFDIQRSHINNKGCLYINSGVENQGIVGMTDVEARIFPAETITVDMFGFAWYRDFEYKLATHAHIFSFKPLDNLSQNCLLYLTGAMFYLKKKYHYNNMCNPTKMADDKLCLPIDATGKPDFAYMQAYISAIKKLVIADVVKWKDRELAALREAAQA